MKSKFEGLNRIALTTKIKNSEVGLGTYISSNSFFQNTKIGKFCSIGQRVITIIATHPTNFASMHPAFYSLDYQAGFTFVNRKKYDDLSLNIEIGNDVWIGSDVKILGGIKIGDGSVVGAGSVVTKNIPSYEVWAGIPAKKIKDRFSSEQKNKLSKIKWWNKDLLWLKTNANYFDDVNKFIERCEEYEKF